VSNPALLLVITSIALGRGRLEGIFGINVTVALAIGVAGTEGRGVSDDGGVLPTRVYTELDHLRGLNR